MPPFSEGDTAKGRQGHIPAHPPRVLPTEDTEMLDGTGVGDDLPVVVIPVPPSWYDHPAVASSAASASVSAVHIYGMGCGRGLCGRRCQRHSSACTDGQKILEGYWKCTLCVPTVFKFIDQVLKRDRCPRPWVPLHRHH